MKRFTDFCGGIMTKLSENGKMKPDTGSYANMLLMMLVPFNLND